MSAFAETLEPFLVIDTIGDALTSYKLLGCLSHKIIQPSRFSLPWSVQACLNENLRHLHLLSQWKLHLCKRPSEQLFFLHELRRQQSFQSTNFLTKHFLHGFCETPTSSTHLSTRINAEILDPRFLTTPQFRPTLVSTMHIPTSVNDHEESDFAEVFSHPKWMGFFRFFSWFQTLFVNGWFWGNFPTIFWKHPYFDRVTSKYQVIQSDLFGGFKWPFQGLSDLHLGYQKVTWKKLECWKMSPFFSENYGEQRQQNPFDIPLY